jgi:flagellar biosynthetic protein FliR
VLAVISEAAIGTMLGFALQCVMAAFTAAGQLLDLQMGLGIGAVFNPVTGGSSAATATALSLTALAYFFGVDGHLAAVRGLQFSLESIPPGSGWPVPPLEAFLRPAGAVFTLALVIAAPAMFVLLMIELAVMVVARVLPQMNVLFVAAPIKILAGFAALAISAPLIAPAAGEAYADAFRLWSGILR